jgi:hypothetical protein
MVIWIKSGKALQAVTVLWVISGSLYAYENDQKISKQAHGVIVRPTPASNLTNLISSTGKHIIKRFKNRQLVPNIGRRSLLRLMVSEPGQIALDLPRLPIINIGGKEVLYNLRREKSVDDQYIIIANLLEAYVKEECSWLRHRNRPGRLGTFWTSEIIYSLAQTFSAPAQIEAYQSQDILKNHDWGAEHGKTMVSVSLILSKAKASILIASFITKKELINLKDRSKKKHFTTEARVIFDLTNGDVTYYHRYDIDNAGKSWFTLK